MADVGVIVDVLRRAVAALSAARSATSAAVVGAARVQARTTEVGFLGIAAGVGAAGERLRRLEAVQTEARVVIEGTVESARRAADAANPGEVVAALNPAVQQVRGASESTAGMLSEIAEIRIAVEDSLRGGQPAKLVALLEQARRGLAEAGQALGEAERHAGEVSATARGLGDQSVGSAAGTAGRPQPGQDRYYVRRDGRVVRRRVVDRDGAPVPRLAWDGDTGGYVEVTAAVAARYRPPMAPFTDVTPAHRERLARAQAMRDRARAIRDGLADTDDPVLAADRDALLGAARSTVTTSAEVMGSLAGDAYVESAYANSDAPPEKLYEGTGPGTLDQVWRVTVATTEAGRPVGERHVVVECKGGASSLGTRQVGVQDYQQGTIEYLKDILAAMERRGTRQEAQLALQVRRALRQGRLDYVHVHAVPRPDGQPRIRAGTFDLRPHPKPRRDQTDDQAD